MKPLHLLSLRTDSHLHVRRSLGEGGCPALRPRSSVVTSPLRWQTCCPQSLKSQGHRHCVNFGAQSHSSVLRCLRFVPSSRTTTHGSLTMVAGPAVAENEGGWLTYCCRCGAVGTSLRASARLLRLWLGLYALLFTVSAFTE